MSHGHNHLHEHNDSNNIGIAFFLNLGFCIIEFFGGFLTNSIAIVSDAVHDLGDSFSLALAWYFQRYSRKGRDVKYSYGYRRFALLGAIINSVVLLIGSIFIIKECSERLVNPQQTDAQGMLLLSILGIAINGFAMLRLRKGSSLNARTVSLHLLEDVLGWIAVLIASIIMKFWDVPILDPLLSIAITLYILYNIYHNLKDVSRVILQGIPENVALTEIERLFNECEDISSFHDLHIWSMDGEYNILSVHLVLNNFANAADLKERLRHKLAHIGLQHATFELESKNEECDMAGGCCE